MNVFQKIAVAVVVMSVIGLFSSTVGFIVQSGKKVTECAAPGLLFWSRLIGLVCGLFSLAGALVLAVQWLSE